MALGLLWVLPALLVLVGSLVLPDENASGQCEGIGFGCTLTPADSMPFLGMLAAPFLAVAGFAAIVIIALVQARSDRRADRR